MNYQIICKLSVLLITATIYSCGGVKISTFRQDDGYVYRSLVENYKYNYRVKLFARDAESIMLIAGDDSHFYISVQGAHKYIESDFRKLNYKSFCSYQDAVYLENSIKFKFSCNTEAQIYPEYGDGYLDIVITGS